MIGRSAEHFVHTRCCNLVGSDRGWFGRATGDIGPSRQDAHEIHAAGCGRRPPHERVGAETDADDRSAVHDATDRVIDQVRHTIDVATAILDRHDALCVLEAEESSGGTAGRPGAVGDDHGHPGSVTHGARAWRASLATMAGWWSRVTRSQEEVEASELATQAHSHGAQEIGACSRGQRVCVHGIIRSVTLRPRASAPSLEAEVYDGSGHITLVWIGHRRLSGVDVGRPITANGRVTCPQGSPTIFNPVYELFPEPADVT